MIVGFEWNDNQIFVLYCCEVSDSMTEIYYTDFRLNFA